MSNYAIQGALEVQLWSKCLRIPEDWWPILSWNTFLNTFMFIEHLFCLQSKDKADTKQAWRTEFPLFPQSPEPAIT